MAAPPPPPCSQWTTDEQVRACCTGLDPAFDLTSAIQFASEILFRLSGRRWPGQCNRTVYPCAGDNCGCMADTWSWFASSGWGWAYAGYPSLPYMVAGGWVNRWAGCRGICHLDCVDLPGTVDEVTQILIDGVPLDPSAYKVEAYRRVCRVDGGHWPCSNHLGAEQCETTDEIVEVEITATGGDWSMTIDGVTAVFDSTLSAVDLAAAIDLAFGAGTIEIVSGGPGTVAPYLIVFAHAVAGLPVVSVADVSLAGPDPAIVATVLEPGCIAGEGTWSISYTQGSMPPPGGQMAAAMFACQIALNQCGGDGCILPQRLKQITREGVSMDFADPLLFLDKGQVGIYEVDLWVKSVNPARLQRRAAVYRADGRKRPTTWT